MAASPDPPAQPAPSSDASLGSAFSSAGSQAATDRPASAASATRPAAAGAATRLRIGLSMFVGGLVGAVGGMAIIASRPDRFEAIRTDLAARPTEERVQLRSRLDQLAASDDRAELQRLAEAYQAASKPVRDAATVYAAWERQQPDEIRVQLQGVTGAAKVDTLRAVLAETEASSDRANGRGDRPQLGDEQFDVVATWLLTIAGETDQPQPGIDDPVLKMLVAVDRLSGTGSSRERLDNLTRRLQPELEELRRLLPELRGFFILADRNGLRDRPRLVTVGLLRNLERRLDERVRPRLGDESQLRTTLAALPEADRVTLLAGAPSEFRRQLAYADLIAEADVSVSLSPATLREMLDIAENGLLSPRGRFGPRGGPGGGRREP